MIASLSGTVQALRLDNAVLEVAGIGYLVHATPATLAALRVGSPAVLATSLVVREDSLTLYGFADDDERLIFEGVQSVSGVGPRMALAILAVHTPDGVRRALVGGDVKALTRVPGIGLKGAQRLILELGDKLGKPSSQVAVNGAPAAPAADTDLSWQVVEALVGLGWSAKVAEDAVATVVADSGSEGVDLAQVPIILRATLRSLGGPRG
ncbi:Holliday junction branch migration protein RuvA [Sanguibacter gelidistatuariae]|uniref:Holliday junction branch migration protein RuvA n=1 Tax=Sanguibacter gelidistatuariae TaxID=1814289 RepID=UPI000B824310|nr:Holliday junction branch migration protein RuvA [Sanguibacter gelidistatuariae]